MAKINPFTPKGFRDFDAASLRKRNFIINTIRKVFEVFGFDPLETPTLEKTDVLTGKYGDEGDQLLFNVLNSGDFLAKIDLDKATNRIAQNLKSKIAEKALRYDLTVPFARYVAQNRGQLTFPYKRYQMQPVWRADRPQKGRYREFLQCDADVIGTDSLLPEFEFLQIYDQVFRHIGLSEYVVKLNNRKILQGVAEAISISNKFSDLTIAIDKLDKIGLEGVRKELSVRKFTSTQIDAIEQVLGITGCNEDRLNALEHILDQSPIGKEGVAEMHQILAWVDQAAMKKDAIKVDITLARGLTYYTGTIFEVVVPNSGIGSISGGGRYDDLTSIFGLPGVSGVGISFGIDRIYDILEANNAWPAQTQTQSNTQVLVTFMEEKLQSAVLDFVEKLRFNGIHTEMYFEPSKLKKQFKYANDKGIPAVVVIGEKEIENGKYQVKFMESGVQQELEPALLINALRRFK